MACALDNPSTHRWPLCGWTGGGSGPPHLLPQPGWTACHKPSDDGQIRDSICLLLQEHARGDRHHLLPAAYMAYVSDKSNDNEWHRWTLFSDRRPDTVLHELGDDTERKACYGHGALQLVSRLLLTTERDIDIRPGSFHSHPSCRQLRLHLKRESNPNRPSARQCQR